MNSHHEFFKIIDIGWLVGRFEFSVNLMNTTRRVVNKRKTDFQPNFYDKFLTSL